MGRRYFPPPLAGLVRFAAQARRGRGRALHPDVSLMSTAVSTATIPLTPARAPVRSDLVAILLTAPLVLYMLVFYALPVVAMLLRSVDSPHWSFDNYRQLAHD